MADAALRAVERTGPGSEAHAAALARAGYWAKAEAIYHRLYDEAKEAEWLVSFDLRFLPISETRGPDVSDRCKALAARRKALMLDKRRFSRARVACERALGNAKRRRR